MNQARKPTLALDDFADEEETQSGDSPARKALDLAEESVHPSPWETVAPSQLRPLSMRAPNQDVAEFKRICREQNFTQPQLLRILLRAYAQHPEREALGREVTRYYR